MQCPTLSSEAETPSTEIDRAVQLIRHAEGLLITAGAGIGVDSGLPDFRGDEGFWQAYPALGAIGKGFEDIARQRSFDENPKRAWGFYGHRLQLYRATVPHTGFALLQQFAERMTNGYFVYTSNVDGQFQRAGFDEHRVVECHGSLHRLQCLAACTNRTWSADPFVPVVDKAACQLISDLPRCPYCNGLARPNVLLFEDWSYQPGPTDSQLDRLAAWEQRTERPLVIEIGAGSAIPSARRKSASLRRPFIRINPRESGVPNVGSVSLPLGALAALQLIAARLQHSP